MQLWLRLFAVALLQNVVVYYGTCSLLYYLLPVLVPSRYEDGRRRDAARISHDAMLGGDAWTPPPGVCPPSLPPSLPAAAAGPRGSLPQRHPAVASP